MHTRLYCVIVLSYSRLQFHYPIAALLGV